MKQNNVISRFIKSISDFSFSNEFIPEKLSKAWWFIFECYLVFLVIMIATFLISFQPRIQEDIQALEDTIAKMPDFQVGSEGFSFAEDFDSGVYESSRWKVVVDLKGENPLHIKALDEGHHVFVNKNALYYEKESMLDFNILPSIISKDEIIQSLDRVENIIYAGLVVASIFGVFLLLLLSLAIWVVMNILQGFMKKDMQSKDTYKIGIYAMTLPNLVLTLIWVTGFYVPGFVWLYLGLVVYYGYNFMKHYQPRSVDLSHIYE
jgi:hypothetical protein